MYRYRAIILLVIGLVVAIWLFGSTQITPGQIPTKLVQAKDGSGIIGYKDTPVLPWYGYHVHDPDGPV